MTDKMDRNFNLFCKVCTKDAGIKLILYCENIVICQTQERLSLFYQKKAGVFDKDNSNELPTPISGTDSEREKLIYIFDDNQAMFCSLAENSTSGFSEKLMLKTVGHTGSFNVTSKDSVKQYSYGYSVHLALSAKHFDIPLTKIVEIAPQFIVVNKTNSQIMYKQH